MRMRSGTLTAEELCCKCLQKLKFTKKLNIYITEAESQGILNAAKSSTQAYRQGKCLLSLC